MISKDTTDESDRLGRKRRLMLVSVVALVVVGLGSGFAVAYEVTAEEWSDDFEDGNAEGWVDGTGEEPTVVEEGASGTYSLQQTDSGDEGDTLVKWEDGPILDLNEEITVRGVVKSDQANENLRTRLGILTAPGEGALLIFSNEFDKTFIATEYDDEPPDDALDTDFHDEWVEFEIHLDGDGSISAKVWEHGTTEPAEYQMEDDLEAVSGEFSLEPGWGGDGREMLLDEVAIEGTEYIDPQLEIDAPSLMHHGGTAEYTVKITQFDEEEGRNVTTDVTEEADVESLNTDGITIDEQNTTLVATEDEEFNDVVTIRAEHDGSINYENVTVAKVKVENLEILPGIWRFAALLGDTTIQVLLITVGVGVVAARASTSFAGLGAMQLAVTIGWFGGWIPTGIALVGLFAALFIGFNLAANIDYAVR